MALKLARFSILDDVHLSERTVWGLGITLIVVGLLLPLAAEVFHTVTWELSGEVERIGPLRPELVILPVGTFQMGSPKDEPGRDDDETLHEVELTRRFAISRTEITQGQYFAVMEERPVDERTSGLGNPCPDAGVGDDLPVVCVDWLDAVQFCNKLSTMEGLEPVYAFEGSEVTWNEDASGYRLPTEAEWEYAARAGTRHRFAGTDDEGAVCDYANVGDVRFKTPEDPRYETFECDDGFEALAPVGSKRPNRWQIYDMTGNAWEWVWDFYGPYSDAHAEDPRGPERASDLVTRGGSWGNNPAGARVANRIRGEPSVRGGDLGFRVARSLPSDPLTLYLPSRSPALALCRLRKSAPRRVPRLAADRVLPVADGGSVVESACLSSSTLEQALRDGPQSGRPALLRSDRRNTSQRSTWTQEPPGRRPGGLVTNSNSGCHPPRLAPRLAINRTHGPRNSSSANSRCHPPRLGPRLARMRSALASVEVGDAMRASLRMRS